MKKIILILAISCIPVNAAVITGGVEYSAEYVRENVNSAYLKPLDINLVKKNIYDKNLHENILSLLQGRTELKDRTLGIFSDGSYGVNYKSEPLYIWYYQNDGVLMNVELKTSLHYPYKTFKYTPDGKLENKTLRVSQKETFIFDKKNKLLGHWVGENCYDENNKVIMTRKIME